MSRYRSRNEIKNPFDQAIISKYTLLSRLNDLQPALRSVPTVCHGAVFPDAEVTQEIGLYGPRSIILTESDLVDVAPALNRLLAHWDATGALSHDELGVINRTLAPTIEIRSGLRAKVARAEKDLLLLTEQQIAAMAMMRSVRRAVFSTVDPARERRSFR